VVVVERSGALEQVESDGEAVSVLSRVGVRQAADAGGSKRDDGGPVQARAR
jgi:hypothetical protein